MSKILLLSVILVTVLFPALGARARNPIKGLKLALAASLGYYVFYMGILYYVGTHFGF